MNHRSSVVAVLALTAALAAGCGLGGGDGGGSAEEQGRKAARITITPDESAGGGHRCVLRTDGFVYAGKVPLSFTNSGSGDGAVVVRDPGGGVVAETPVPAGKTVDTSFDLKNGEHSVRCLVGGKEVGGPGPTGIVVTSPSTFTVGS